MKHDVKEGYYRENVANGRAQASSFVLDLLLPR